MTNGAPTTSRTRMSMCSTRRTRVKFHRTRGRRFPWKIDRVFSATVVEFPFREPSKQHREQHYCARTVYDIRIHKDQGSKVRETAAAATVSISSVGYVILSCAHVNRFTFERVPASRHGRPAIAFVHYFSHFFVPRRSCLYP